MIDQIQVIDRVCGRCVELVTTGITAENAEMLGDVEYLKFLENNLRSLPAVPVIGEPVPAEFIRRVAEQTCRVCECEITGDSYAVTAGEIEVTIPADMIRVPRSWDHVPGWIKPRGPLPNDDGGMDVVLFVDDWERVARDVTGWIGTGKYETYAERLEHATAKATDRAGAMLAHAGIGVSVEEFARGVMPARGVEIPAELMEKLPAARRAKAHAVTIEAESKERGTAVETFEVRGVRGMDDCNVSAPRDRWEFHIPSTAGWINKVPGASWWTVFNSAKPAKQRRALKKLIATGEFEVTPV